MFFLKNIFIIISLIFSFSNFVVSDNIPIIKTEKKKTSSNPEKKPITNDAVKLSNNVSNKKSSSTKIEKEKPQKINCQPKNNKNKQKLPSNATALRSPTFKNLYVNNRAIARNLLQVNNQAGQIGVRLGNDNGTERVLSRLPVRINFQPSAGSPNSFVVVGTSVVDSLQVNDDQQINGSLNVNGDITLQNASVITNAQSVGSGTGIFSNKSGNILQLKSLVPGSNVSFDTSSNDQITISAVGAGLGDVTGPASSTDNAITRFDGTTGKVIKNSVATLDDSGNLTTTGAVTATQINIGSSAVVTDGQNVGSGTGLIFRDKTGNDLNFKSLVEGSNIIFDTTSNDQITISAIGSGLGDVVGPAASLDNAIARFDGTTGKVIQNSIVTLDDSGNISTAGQITASQFNGNATSATNFTGSLNGDVIGTQSSTTVSFVGGQSASSVANATTKTNDATSSNIPNRLVLRDGSGNFAATNITSDLTGNATTSTSSINFTGPLAGNVSGTQSATVVNTVGGVTAANVASGSNKANAATASNIPNEIVLRDSSGNFAANTITANLVGNVTGNATTATTAVNFTGTLAGNVSGTQNATVVNTVGGVTAANVASGSNKANAATASNIPNEIVLRDGSGNFAATTVTADLIGNASGNVLKTGDTMSGNLNMATQSEVRLQDASGGEYIGLNAPSTVGTSYTVSLPATAPIANQVLAASSPTSLNWVTNGSSLPPVSSRIIYVAKYGNDTTGNGSQTSPYLTLSKAIGQANLISTSNNPIDIDISPGVYIEDNSTAAIALTANGISINGTGQNNVVIVPNTLSNDLISVTARTRFQNMAFLTSGSSTASAVSITGGDSVIFVNVLFQGFNTGVTCSGVGTTCIFNSCFFLADTTAINNNNLTVIAQDCIIQGAGSGTAVISAGAAAELLFTGGVYTQYGTAFNISNNSTLNLKGGSIRINTVGINLNNSGKLTLQSTLFDANPTTGTVTNIQASGAGTNAIITGCGFTQPSLATNNLIAIQVTNSAVCEISGGEIQNYNTALIVGTSGDTSSTQMVSGSLTITNCTNDIIQNGTSSLNFNSGVASGSKITINNSANVNLSYFDPDNNNTLQIGSFSDKNTKLIGASIGAMENPQLDYRSSIYGTQAIGYFNQVGNPATFFSSSLDNANLASITSDRTKQASLELVSDQGSSIGGITALRGWNLTKNSSTAELAFQYQNTDTSGQVVIPQYTVMQLDGVNNQLQLPTAGTQIVFDGDTNLYRSSANVLSTDDNLIVGGLTANRAVVTDASKQLSSSNATDTEVSYLSGVTSPIQTQLNAKVSRTGDTMSGALQLPAGTTSTPSLNFTGSATTGFSAASDNLSISTAATERMKISSAGVVSINNLTPAGVVHNDASGNLSTSLITNSDIVANANIVDSKLATISTAGKVANSATTATSANTASSIVARDSSGNFAANTVTANLVGNVTGNADTATSAITATSATTATTATNFTGPLVGNVTGTQGATVVSTVGGQTATAVASATVAANAATPTNTASTIVSRDASSNFATNMITINGTVTNSTDVATKEYVDTVASLGLEVKAPARVVSLTNVAISGLQTIDGVALNATDRVLLVGQTNPVQNGLWEAQTGAWTRPTDFAAGTAAGQAYVLILEGIVEAGSSWVCTTPTAIINTDPLTFVLFSTPSQTTAANVGTGAGQIFRDKTGQTINLKTIAAGPHIVVTNNTNDITLSTDATSANTPSTIVARDSSGNFAATTITSNLTGNASGNVLKTGDTMTGNLNMATQSEVRFQDASGGEYVGLNAPSTVGTSYTVSLPSAAPTANQVLAASSPTTLNWITSGSNVTPTASRNIYVAKYGNDTTGDGSTSFPYLTLSKAIDEANLISTSTSPVAIIIYPGTYVEDNSTAPLAVTADGISINGMSQENVIITPNTLSNDLISTNSMVRIQNIAFNSGGAPGASTAAGINIMGGSSIIENALIQSFGTGVACTGGTSCIFTNCFIIANTVGISNNNLIIIAQDCAFQGIGTGTALVSSGSAAQLLFTNGVYTLFSTVFDISNGSSLNLKSASLRTNTIGLNLSNGGTATLQASLFDENITTGSVTNIQASDAGSRVVILGCGFDQSSLATNDLTAIQVTNSAVCEISGGEIQNYNTALIVGTSGDTSSTQMVSGSLTITNCTNDIIQNGTSSLNFNSGVASTSKISINDSTNVNLAYFDPENNNTLQIGSFADQNTQLIGAATGVTGNPEIDYRSSMYGTKAIGYFNQAGNPATSFVQSSDNTNIDAITTDRTKQASLQLVSDQGAPVGGTSALRGWNLTKNSSTAELAFQYQNTDTVGQSAVPQYTVIQLDGLNNQLQLPNANTQIVFDGDTNLYRSSANVLSTDDNLIVGGLTANRAVVTDASKQLTSSTANDTEVSYLSGVTSPIQTQLNGKVSTSGSTMTGNLTLPAGTTSVPSLNFTGSTTTGLSANTDNLSISTSATERMKISSAGVVSINNLTPAGVVHNDSSGNLTTSLITNSDIAAAANIADSKLATITTAGKVANSATTATSANTTNSIVARDGSGNFAANVITASLTGNVTGSASLNVLKAGDTMTGSLQLPTGTTSAPSLNFTGSPTTGFSATTDNLSISTAGSERMKVSSAGVVSIDNLTTVGVVHNDSSGNLTTSLITNADIAAAANIADSKLATITTAGKVANSATTATNTNTASTIVSRDSSGNFAAGTVTANLNGNATSATTATTATNATNATTAVNFTGSLNGNVTGTQGATVVSTVGGQTAANVASATVAANAATPTNTPGTIVSRDGSGNFAANVITASLIGNITGSASLNVLKSGDTMTGNLTIPAGTTSVPSLNFIGSTSSGLSTTSDNLSFSTAGNERMKISSAGVVSINNLTTVGVVHNDSSGNLTTSLITNADIAAAANIADSKLATITTSGKVANSATTATSTNTANSIVARDSSGNFVANNITASLTGNASSATTATTATNFTGSLSGNVTGTQSATVVAVVPSSATINGQSAANTVINPGLSNDNAISKFSGTTGKIIQNSGVTIDASNNISTPGSVTATGGFVGNASSATTATTAINFTGSLSGNVTGTQSATVVSAVPNSATINGTTAANVVVNTGASTTTAIPKFSDTTGKVIQNSGVTIDASNNISTVGSVTATGGFVGNASSATTATTATNFTGSLSGNVTGTQSATVVAVVPSSATINGQSAANTVINPGLSNDNAISKFSGTTGKVIQNSGVTIDASNNISTPGNVTATGGFVGDVTGSASLNVLKAGDTMTGSLTLPVGSAAAPSLNFTGNLTTGISSAVNDTLSFDAAGVEVMNINSTSINALQKMILFNLICNQAIQRVTPTSGSNVVVAGTTSILILTPAANLTSLTITFPSTGLTNGQTLSISCTANITTLTMTGGTISNPATTFTTALRWASFIYYSTTNTWYRIG